MQILLKKAMLILVIVVLVTCMLFTFIACNDDSGKNKDSGKSNGDARFVKCPECNGSGEKFDAYKLKIYKCSRCNGKGYIIK